MKIFLDVDGVLIDGWHADDSRRRRWDAAIGTDLRIDRAAFQRLFFGVPDSPSTSPMAACMSGRRDLHEALAEVLPQVGYGGRVADFVRYWFENDSNVDMGVLGLIDEIRRCGQVQLFLATAQEHHRARYLWNDLGLREHFDDIFHSAAIGCSKKDVRFYETINRRLGSAADERPLFFDDQPAVIETAGRAGWDGVVFTSLRDIERHPRLRAMLLRPGRPA
ncbi:MAG: HAD family hydrolase [Burkholderiaceae bacterium]